VQGGEVSLSVFDVLGQRVATLVDGFEVAGSHAVRFEGSGNASGVYFYTLRAGGVKITKMLHVMR
jgi:hypothetical protein